MEKNNYEMFKAVLEQMPEGIIIINVTDEIIFVNKAAEEIRHIQANQILGHGVISCHPEKSHERVNRALQFLKNEKTKTFQRMV